MNETTPAPTPGEASTTPITVMGVSFTAPAPYTEGHVCSGREAHVLNVELAENLRNNFSKRVKAVKEANPQGIPAPQLTALRKEFETYALQYRFGEGRVSRGGDPIQHQALIIARGAVKAHWAKKGLTLDESTQARFDSDVARVAQLDNVVAEAQRRVDATATASLDVLGPGPAEAQETEDLTANKEPHHDVATIAS